MGHHYVPQNYLRKFETFQKPGYIWMFDRIHGQQKSVPIKAIAQEADYFAPEVEAALNLEVEAPAQPVINKLVTNQRLSSEERRALALYIAVMFKRVPHRRRKALQLVPGIIDSTVEEIRLSLQSLIGVPGYDPIVINARLAQIDELCRKYNNAPPVAVIKEIRLPWPSLEIVELLERMTWRIVSTTGPSLYITSDNPAFYFDAHGLNNRQSEVYLPLSSNQALHCCWQGPTSGLEFSEGAQQFVKEMNRRLASTTSRFVFYHEDAVWLPKLLSKSAPVLSRIIW
jgi:hypothetical protein